MCGIYLDYQSASPVDPRVHEFAECYLSSDFGNPSALHSRGLAARAALEEARARVAELINAESPESIIFTAGVTEANNLAIGERLYAAQPRARSFWQARSSTSLCLTP